MTLLNRAGAFASNPNNWIYTILVLFIVGFAGGAFGQSGNVYTERSVQQSAQVLRGRIVQAREVLVQHSDSTRYAGGTAGAAWVAALVHGLAGAAAVRKRCWASPARRSGESLAAMRDRT